ncbi:uncharacterized protein BJ212DRAFT_1496273 [Suillus subaureus]|uniref:Uncharacterized protein n=1 Tax=Suillus subaureus TaxID=48587 RepID=A0A9P7DRD2_9AGAM|nr:uncharacterized protein BJ212DRAFT_1496273 [Suillus subaureus]KAG1801150.1 hypothetical protein BJ212DRAFT_1496273 [Suillus subaureus]
MSDHHEVYCQDFHQGGQACTCECFTPPSNPDAPYYCQECQHGFSKHPKALDPTRDTPRKQDGTTSGKKRLISIFKEKTSATGSAARSLQSAASSKSMLDQKIGVKQARDEVMNGYRTGLNSQNNKNEVFPLAFGYVNLTEKGKGIGIPSFPWVLISKERLRYDVVNIERPDGNDLAQFRGRPKCPVKDANIIIALWRRIPEHVYASWDPEYRETGDDGMFLDSDDASSFEAAKPIILTRAAAAKLKLGAVVKHELEEPVPDLRASSIVNAASQESQPTKLFLESSNADIDELPDFHSPIVQRRRVAMPPDFVEPQPSDIILRGIRDPDSPSAPPRINPWSEDYFIGDVNIAV